MPQCGTFAKSSLFKILILAVVQGVGEIFPVSCYRTGAKKAKTHIGFDINRGIPRKLFLTDGKGAERPFVGKILEPGETGIMDRGYQSHQNFDLFQAAEKHFICRVKAKTNLITNETQPIL